jgi:hypothetical protein
MRERIVKFERGDPLTDEDCRELYKFFFDMEKGCEVLGGDYNLFRHKMREHKDTVQRYLDARRY